MESARWRALAVGLMLLGALTTSEGAAVCKMVIQGSVDGCDTKDNDFELCQADIFCEGDTVQLEVHPAMSEFSRKYEGVKLVEREDAKHLVRLLSPKALTIRDSTFNNLQLGRSMYIVAADKKIELTLHRSGFFNNTGKFSAPLLLDGGSTLDAVNSTFVKNVAKKSGAIVLRGGSSAEIDTSSFSGNGLPDKAPYAGALHITQGSSANLTRSGLTFNYGRMAGAVLLDGASSFEASVSDITNNTAAPYDRDEGDVTSGAVLARGQSEVLLRDLPLKSNAGPHGGALLATGGSTLAVEGTQVHTNEGGDGLGAVALIGGGGGDGDGIPSSGSDKNAEQLSLEGVQFTGNLGPDVTCGEPGAAEELPLENGGDDSGMQWVSGEFSC